MPCLQKVFSAILLTIMLLGTPAARSQTSNRPALPQEALRKTVHLALGQTTLAEAVKSLAAQTGLPLEVADYLQDREIVAQMDDVTAVVAMNTLADLNDLKWKSVEKNRWRLVRPMPPLPRTITELPHALAAVLPKDFRAYLMVGVSYNDLLRSAPQDTTLPPAPITADKEIIESRGAHLRDDLQEAWLLSLEPKPKTGVCYPYAKMTPEQQRELLLQMVLYPLELIPYSVLHDELPPDERDPKVTTLQISGEYLEFGTHRSIGGGNSFTGSAIKLSPAQLQPTETKQP